MQGTPSPGDGLVVGADEERGSLSTDLSYERQHREVFIGIAGVASGSLGAAVEVVVLDQQASRGSDLQGCPRRDKELRVGPACRNDLLAGDGNGLLYIPCGAEIHSEDVGNLDVEGAVAALDLEAAVLDGATDLEALGDDLIRASDQGGKLISMLVALLGSRLDLSNEQRASVSQLFVIGAR